LFSNQKSQFGKILEGLAMENLGIFNNHLAYFTAIGNILGPFGMFCGNLLYFFTALVFCTKKNLATLFRSETFLTLLNVDLSLGGQSWEKQLEPLLTFVQDQQDDPLFVDWIKYLTRSDIFTAQNNPGTDVMIF
jgi:hypothetical protein